MSGSFGGKSAKFRPKSPSCLGGGGIRLSRAGEIKFRDLGEHIAELGEGRLRRNVAAGNHPSVDHGLATATRIISNCLLGARGGQWALK